MKSSAPCIPELMNNRIELISRSDEFTFETGQRLGSEARPGDVFALRGDLGAGKTVLAKGIAAGLGIVEEITSPTFTLLEIYDSEIPFYHFDLYRIGDESEFDNLNFEDYWDNEGVSVVEWSERAGNRIPENAVFVTLEYLDDVSRRILIEYTGNRRFN